MSGCACGRPHAPGPLPATGAPVALDPAPVAVSGRLICADRAQMMTALRLLPDHVAASRAEPGCLRFDLAQSDDPLVWTLAEVFADPAAFAAHQGRTGASDWGRNSADIARDFQTRPAQVRIRPESTRDAAGIAALLDAAFGGEAESRLVAALRGDGDLAIGLIAECEGVILGHVALSPLAAPAPALALAPLAVHPAVQRRGLGAALVRAALDAAAGHAVVVLGDPAYYARFGFAPARLTSPYAGPHLLATGPALPADAIIRHAPAFAAL